MYLNISKAFPLLKFKPTITNFISLKNQCQSQGFDLHQPINSFGDLALIDYRVGHQVRMVKKAIKNYIDSIKSKTRGKVHEKTEEIKKDLETLLNIIEKVEFENIEPRISELFKGPDGLYALYRYIWSPDLLNLLSKFKMSLVEQNSSPEEFAHQSKAQVYNKLMEDVIHQEMKNIIKQYAKELYLIPENWGYTLLKGQQVDQKFLNILQQEDLTLNQKIAEIVCQLSDQEYSSTDRMKEIQKVIIYAQVELKFYDYLTSLKSILLNKVSGVLTGDYETWERTYQVCLKAYSRKEAARKEGGLQIDQLLETSHEDTQFTSFLKKCDITTVSMCSLNFYYKNCEETTRSILRPIVMKKISSLLDRNDWKHMEDILEYLESEASNQEIATIMEKLISSLHRVISPTEQIDFSSTLHYLEKGISDFIGYLIKNIDKSQNAFNQLISEQLLNKMVCTLKQSKLFPSTQTNLWSQQPCREMFIYSFINCLSIQCYEEEIPLEQYLNQNETMSQNLVSILILLRQKLQISIHDDCVLLWNQIKINCDKQKKNKEIVEVLLRSSRDREFKFDVETQEGKESISDICTDYLKKLSDSQFQERKEIEIYFNRANSEQISPQYQSYVSCYMGVKGFKDRLLHQNVLNVGCKLNPYLPFSETVVFAVEMLTILTPISIEEPVQELDPFDICDLITSEEPIECLKLIYKKATDYAHCLDFGCLKKFPSQFYSYYGAMKCIKHPLQESCETYHIIPEAQRNLYKTLSSSKARLDIATIDQFQQFRKFYFYIELMVKAFNKLNQKSQKGIKELKIIYDQMHENILKLWKFFSLQIINADLQEKIKENLKLRKTLSSGELQQSDKEEFTKQIFSKMSKAELPYFDNMLLERNWLTRLCFQFVSGIGKVVRPEKQKICIQEMFDPLSSIQVDASLITTYGEQAQIMGEIFSLVKLIQNTCCMKELENNERVQKEKKVNWWAAWRKTTLRLTSSLAAIFQKKLKQLSAENIWIKVFCLHLKAEIVKIFIPFLLREPFNGNQQQEVKKQFRQEESVQIFQIFEKLCEIIERISPGEEDHLISFLELVDSYSSEEGIKENGERGKVLKQFLYHSIETLLKFVLQKGIRVRSYHFFKFIKTYAKISSTGIEFFNSVIAFYIKKLFSTDYLPGYDLPQEILEQCDSNLVEGQKNSVKEQTDHLIANKAGTARLSKKNSMNKENSSVRIMMAQKRDQISNQFNEIKGAIQMVKNSADFQEFTKFQCLFTCHSQKICTISMLVNLFCRLNFKGLTKGIQVIWGNSLSSVLSYLRYIKNVTPLLQKQMAEYFQIHKQTQKQENGKKTAKSKTCDILNVDCFGNMSTVVRSILWPPSMTTSKSPTNCHTIQEKGFKCNLSSKGNEPKNGGSNSFQRKNMQGVKQVIDELLNIICITMKCPHVQAKIRNSLQMPVKKILEVIKNSRVYGSIPSSDLMEQKSEEQESSNISIKIQQSPNSSQSSLKEPVASSSILDFITSRIAKMELAHPTSMIPSKLKTANHQILELLIACYNISFASGIKSNIHIDNLLFISKDLNNKNRVFEINSAILDRRYSRMELRNILLSHDQTLSLKKPICQISGPALKLVRGLIDKLVCSYGKLFTAGKSVQENLSEHSCILFTNLKILTVSVLNNSELISELLTYQSQLIVEEEKTSKIQMLTVYDLMLHSLSSGLCIFLQLYLLFLRTNSGFVISSTNDQVVPYNQSIEISVRTYLAQQLKDGFQQRYTNTNRHENVINALILTTEISKNQQNFRAYKFTSLANKQYKATLNDFSQNFNKHLLYIVIETIQRNKLSQISSKIYLLYDRLFNLLIKNDSVALMKMDLDSKLKGLTEQKHPRKTVGKEKIQQFIEKEAKKLAEGVLFVEDVKANLKNKMKENGVEMVNSVSDSRHFRPHIFQTDAEIIPEFVYTLVSSLNGNSQLDPLLKMLIDYSSKQCLWGDELEYQDIMENLSIKMQVSIDNYVFRDNTHEDLIRTSMGDQIDRNPQDNRHQINSQINAVSLNDGIIEEDLDGIVENQENSEMDIIIENDPSYELLEDCISGTSLKFLEENNCRPEQIAMRETEEFQQERASEVEATKEHLLDLYEESTVNPEAMKQLLNAIKSSSTKTDQLLRFVKNPASLDPELFIIVKKELSSRGHYLDKDMTAIEEGLLLHQVLKNQLGNNNKQKMKLHIDQAAIYQRLYEKYQKEKIQNQEYFQYMQVFVPEVSIAETKKLLELSSKHSNSENPFEPIMMKFILNPHNAQLICQEAIKILLSKGQEGDKGLKSSILNNFFSMCIKERLALPIILTGLWNDQQNKIILKKNESLNSNMPSILELLLKMSIEQILQNQQSVSKLQKSSQDGPEQKIILEKKRQKLRQLAMNSFVHSLWDYFQQVEEYKCHHNRESDEKSEYPYYLLQEQIRISDKIVNKFCESIFARKMTFGYLQSEDKSQQSPQEINEWGEQVDANSYNDIALCEEFMLTLTYIDPSVFEKLIENILSKLGQRTSEIVGKEMKILKAFTNQREQNNLQGQRIQQQQQLEKEEQYWDFRQSKKSTRGFMEEVEFFRHLLVDLSINLLPKFKQNRFNFHCGKQFREWRLELELLKQKVLSQGSMEGLKKLEGKAKQLDDWRREEMNTLVKEEIIPIVQQKMETFSCVLSEIEEFISQFLDFFGAKQREQKIVIYSLCSKLYEILLASELMTVQETCTYHSMAQLKTLKSMNLGSVGNNRNSLRKNSIIMKPIRNLSICQSYLKPEFLLQKIGTDCSFLYPYIGFEPELKRVHAKYSDKNNRLRILWQNRSSDNSHNEPNPLRKEKTITCNRNRILEDSISQIDEAFIKLPVRIKFEGEIGIDYGGVTREWITLFMKQFINPDLGLFELSANKLTFQPSKNSHIVPNHLMYFRKLGIVVGKALKENWLLELSFTKSFLKHLLGATLFVEDLEDIDPETAKSLLWILKNDIGEQDCLGLNFTHETEVLGKKEVKPLIPGGLDIPVTESNKREYVKMLANIRMTEGIREQSKAFMSGLEAMIPYSVLKLFSYKEISLYLAGMPHIDIDSMQKTARFQNFSASSNQIVWFWEILRGWKQEDLANFLFYLTGSYKVPYGGFEMYPVGFNKMPGCVDYLPVAHTCFSVLDLSTFSSKQKMEKLLKKAVKEGKGFSVS